MGLVALGGEAPMTKSHEIRGLKGALEEGVGLLDGTQGPGPSRGLGDEGVEDVRVLGLGREAKGEQQRFSKEIGWHPPSLAESLFCGKRVVLGYGGMTDWKKNPLKDLEAQVTAPIREALAQLQKQLEMDKAALREFEIRLERVSRQQPKP